MSGKCFYKPHQVKVTALLKAKIIDLKYRIKIKKRMLLFLVLRKHFQNLITY